MGQARSCFGSWMAKVGGGDRLVPICDACDSLAPSSERDLPSIPCRPGRLCPKGSFFSAEKNTLSANRKEAG